MVPVVVIVWIEVGGEIPAVPIKSIDLIGPAVPIGLNVQIARIGQAADATGKVGGAVLLLRTSKPCKEWACLAW